MFSTIYLTISSFVVSGLKREIYTALGYDGFSARSEVCLLTTESPVQTVLVPIFALGSVNFFVTFGFGDSIVDVFSRGRFTDLGCVLDWRACANDGFCAYNPDFICFVDLGVTNIASFSATFFTVTLVSVAIDFNSRSWFDDTETSFIAAFASLAIDFNSFNSNDDSVTFSTAAFVS